MTKKNIRRREFKFDPDKLLVAGNIRLNLMLTSLYLTAYEMLKLAIVEGTKDFFIFLDEVTEEDVQEFKKTMQDRLAERFRESYLNQVEEYEKVVGVRLQDRDFHGLIPSCKWLQKQGVLTKSEIEEIIVIRDHRNEIAHELPTLLLSQDSDVNLQHFQKIHQLLHKIDVFWARNDLLIDPETLDENDITQVPDEEIISLRLGVLKILTNSVIDYLNEKKQSNTEGHEVAT